MVTQRQLEANRRNAKKGGRKKGSKTRKTIEKEKANEILEREILKEFIPIIEAKLNLAKGIYKEKLGPDGKKVIVYRVAPDGRSLEWILERLVGKAKETHDIPQLDELTKVMQSLLTNKKQ